MDPNTGHPLFYGIDVYFIGSALAGVAVLFKALTLGHFPFIALGLALSFAIYGYIRKLTPVAALDGMTIETCILLPFTAGILVFWGVTGQGAFTPTHAGTDILLILGGPLTALPLILFAIGVSVIAEHDTLRIMFGI